MNSTSAIHKHRLDFPARQDMILMTYRDSKILHVDLDPRGIPSLWLLVNTANERVQRRIRILPTGIVDLEPDRPGENTIIGEHIGTVVVEDEVWHFFDMGQMTS